MKKLIVSSKYYLLSLFIICFSNPALANLNAKATKLTKNVESLGGKLVILFLVIAGILVASGDDKAPGKLKMAVTGGLVVTLAGSIWKWLQ